jgi:hypothetical protein
MRFRSHLLTESKRPVRGHTPDGLSAGAVNQHLDKIMISLTPRSGQVLSRLATAQVRGWLRHASHGNAANSHRAVARKIAAASWPSRLKVAALLELARVGRGGAA